MITLQHTLVTLMGLRGNEREMDEEIQYVLLPDTIRRYCGPRQYSHFEQAYDGSDVSWFKYPLTLKGLTKEEVDRLPKHIVAEIKKCDLGETTNIRAFEEHNTHLSPKYFAGVKKHLTQDFIFDRFVREKIDCSEMYDGKYVFNGQEYDGKGIRGLIADMEHHGVYVLAYMLNKAYGITANQEWFDKHVKARLDEEYPEELAESAYGFMKIKPEINERITNGDWTHLEEGPLPLEDYVEMYEEVIKEMPKIDYERKIAEDRIANGKPAFENKKADVAHEEVVE